MEWFCSRALPLPPPGSVRGPVCRFMLGSTGTRHSFFLVLGHTAQCQHIKTDVTYTHRFVQVKFDDGDLLYRALMAEQTATMTAIREKR